MATRIVPGVVLGVKHPALLHGATRTSVANAEFIAALAPLMLMPAGACSSTRRWIAAQLCSG